MYAVVKRLLDVVFSLLLLIVCAPLFLLIGAAIVIECPGAVFFVQPRLGRGGRRFGLVKFRTLRRRPNTDDVSGSHMALTGKDRDITAVGSFLRRSGLNELPQLLNIIAGQMSFVGPRPAVLHHESHYTEWHRRRLAVRPGVTGLAQVCGRNVIPWGWRVALDRHYVDHMSFSLDLAILLKTAYVVLWGIGAEGDEKLYFDFTPPEMDILAPLRQRGVLRTFLRFETKSHSAARQE
jgi:lipopolysaccharide/colanic/teichoic acid biosynthesis glycosyltransferase